MLACLADLSLFLFLHFFLCSSFRFLSFFSSSSFRFLLLISSSLFVTFALLSFRFQELRATKETNVDSLEGSRLLRSLQDMAACLEVSFLLLLFVLSCLVLLRMLRYLSVLVLKPPFPHDSVLLPLQVHAQPTRLQQPPERAVRKPQQWQPHVRLSGKRHGC